MADNDLISRAVAIDALTDKNLRRNVDSVCDGDMNRTRRAAQRAIAQLPAVDAAPVVHARWIQYEPDLHGTKPLECGACHYLFARLYPRDFCPHCGAKMDGGETDGKS